MSRIFDALQRTGVEQSGVEYPDVISVITEVLELPLKPEPAPVAPESSEAILAPDLAAAFGVPSAEKVEQKPVTQELPDFPSLNLSVVASSRLVIFTEPDSLAAEKFRFLGVRLRQMQQSRTIKKILITSTIPEEGKSFVAANLAGVLARRSPKVLLIEGDLRRPTLAEHFGLGRLAGLCEWLQGDHSKVMNIYRLEGPGFWFMPAGNTPSNPLELMQSGGMSQLMGQVSNMFDWVIVDSPPLLPLADTTVWTRVTDGALLVAREGKSEKAMLQRGLEMIKKSDLLGVVLNGSSHAHQDYYQKYAPAPKK